VHEAHRAGGPARSIAIMNGSSLSLRLHDLLGLAVAPDQLTFVQMSLRATIVFGATLTMVRLSHRRFLAGLSAFDAIVGFILASTLARAVNGTAAFGPTLGCGFVIIGLHRVLTALAFRFSRFGLWIKGRPDVIVRAGDPDWDRMRSHGISQEDLLEEAPLNACVHRIGEIELATLERNGQMSVVPMKP
jgi:uncharacterized membrane protein YcaP (DUF421 family)